MNNDKINDLFTELLKNILPSRLITNFIIVAEVADEDSTELTVSISNNLTPWNADGMLLHARNMIADGDILLNNTERDVE